MRTPGDDEDLAAGLLFAEGAVAGRDEIVSLSRDDNRATGRERRDNVIVATLTRDAAERAGKLRRRP